MRRRPKLYLAGPTVFMPDKVERGRMLKALCDAHGCEALYPLDADFGPTPGASAIAGGCLAMLTVADAVIADLSPFRGPHVDDGTAFELGFAVARNVPVFGYANDLRPLSQRITPRSPGADVDQDGIMIETLGEAFNAMIAGTLTRTAFATAADAVAAAARHLRLA